VPKVCQLKIQGLTLSEVRNGRGLRAEGV